jgi:hypothetical protein
MAGLQKKRKKGYWMVKKIDSAWLKIAFEDQLSLVFLVTNICS